MRAPPQPWPSPLPDLDHAVGGVPHLVHALPGRLHQLLTAVLQPEAGQHYGAEAQEQGP
jgi:hypothetical protein